MLVHNIIAAEKKDGVKKARRKQASGDFSVFLNDEADEAIPSVSNVKPTIAMNSLLSLHEIVNQEQVIKENIEQGEQTLKKLEKYTNSIINGEDSSLSDLSSSLESRVRSADKELEDVLDAIALRAAVEAAKKESA